jgi:uncharacterized membrane protein YcaP (DUF421 family)
MHEMFVLTVPVLEKIIRPILVYLLLVALVRVFGKRELAQLNPFDLIVLLCLSNTLQNAIIGNDNTVTGGALGAVSLLGINWLMVRALYNRPRLQAMVEGRPTPLIKGGKVLEDALRSQVLTHEELRSAIHRQGFAGIKEVEEVILEPSGTFGIKPKELAMDPNSAILAKLEAIEKQLAAMAKP